MFVASSKSLVREARISGFVVDMIFADIRRTDTVLPIFFFFVENNETVRQPDTAREHTIFVVCENRGRSVVTSSACNVLWRLGGHLTGENREAVKTCHNNNGPRDGRRLWFRSERVLF